MGHQLSWYDKYVIPVTKEYKNFVDEMKNTSPEQWFRDGERIFTEKERKYMDIYEHKQKKMEAETKKIRFGDHTDYFWNKFFQPPK
jgi:uncharacterized short protein YbdD (DUF466 family)